jgi:hypothetical protein
MSKIEDLTWEFEQGFITSDKLIKKLNEIEEMSKLIWQLYNDNLISEEVANLLLDKHYNRLQHKRYK